MQLSPLLTGACGSPLVATILPSLTPTSTPHPVPQKRQGALPHLILASAASASTAHSGLSADAPAAANAAAAALAFKKSRLESSIMFLPCIKVVQHARPASSSHRSWYVLQRIYILKIVIGHANGDDVGHLMQVCDNIDLSLHGICLYNRHDLTIGKHAMDLYPFNCGNLSGNSFGRTLHACH